MAASPPRDRRRGRRRWWFALAALVVLAGAAVGAYAWVLDHWFVGVDEDTDTVAVYRGINASVLGLDLYREESDSGIAVSDLSQDLRGKVSDGIVVDDRQEAEDRVAMLREQSLPRCEEQDEAERTPGEAPATSSPLDPGAPPAAGSGAPVDVSASSSTAPSSTAPSSTAPSSTAPSSTASSSTSSGTGRDCREAE